MLSVFTPGSPNSVGGGMFLIDITACCDLSVLPRCISPALVRCFLCRVRARFGVSHRLSESEEENCSMELEPFFGLIMFIDCEKSSIWEDPSTSSSGFTRRAFAPVHIAADWSTRSSFRGLFRFWISGLLGGVFRDFDVPFRLVYSFRLKTGRDLPPPSALRLVVDPPVVGLPPVE